MTNPLLQAVGGHVANINGLVIECIRTVEIRCRRAARAPFRTAASRQCDRVRALGQTSLATALASLGPPLLQLMPDEDQPVAYMSMPEGLHRAGDALAKVVGHFAECVRHDAQGSAPPLAAFQQALDREVSVLRNTGTDDDVADAINALRTPLSELIS